MLRGSAVALVLAVVWLSACGDSGKSSIADSGAPAGNIDEVLAPYAGLCKTRANELTAALCPGGGTNCDPSCTYYLAADGSDQADGHSPTTPWQTLARLSDAKLTDGQSVCFRRGDTFRGSVQLAYGQHFTTPVAFQSYGDANLPRPILSGAKVLPKTWAPTTAAPSIYQLDVSHTLRFGKPFTRNGKSYTPHDRVFQLFANGKHQPIARFPNIGAGDSVVRGVDLPAGNYSVIDAIPSTGRYRDDALPASSPLQTPTNFAGAALFYKSIRWIIDTTEIASHDPATHEFTTKEALSCASQGGSCLGWGYFLVDHIAALDAPGEWAYDPAAKLLYFWPPQGVDLASAQIEVSTYAEDVEPPSWANASDLPQIQTTTGLDLQGGSGVRVRGLSFRHYSRTGVWASSDLNPSSADAKSSTTDIFVEGCEFLYTGASGVVLARWSSPANVPAANRVNGCTFQSQTSQAVVLRTTGSELSCNTIADIGRLEEYPRFGMTRSEYTVHDQGMAVISEMGDGNKLLFNRFERTASAGLSFRSPDTLVAFNYFRHACYTKGDCGAIHTYTWDDAKKFDAPSVAGSLLTRNVILETKGATEGGSVADGWVDPLGNGMFLDFGARDFAVRQNVVAGNPTCGIMHQRNRNVLTEDNLLYDNTRYNPSGYILGGLSVITDVPPTQGTFRNNQIFSLSPDELPLVLRGDSPAQAGSFAGNLYFDPFTWETRTKDGRWNGFTVFQVDNDNHIQLLSLAGWQSVAESDAKGAPMSWQAANITAQAGNLISNSDFTNGVAGWSTEGWSSSKISADVHPELGPCLKYERNGAEGGRIGALSNRFALLGGHTYWVHFWIAPDATVKTQVQEPFTALIAEDQPWTYVPNDKLREFTYLYSPKTDVANAQFELTPYPDYAERFWIDDVLVQDVTATPYQDAAIARFDQPLPTNTRSVMIYNDTEDAVSVPLPANTYVRPDGSPFDSTVDIRAFGGMVLIPTAWSKDPVKAK